VFRRKIAAGMEPGEARRRAQLEFAGIEQIKEDCRDVRGRWLKIWGRISATRREHGDFQLDQCGDVAPLPVKIRAAWYRSPGSCPMANRECSPTRITRTFATT
jgi:hypothetical protein